MADVADETLLARAIADILVAAGLGVWRRDGSKYATGEHALVIDQPMPTTILDYSLVTPMPAVRESRTGVLYRVQVTTRFPSPGLNMSGIRARAQRIALLFDHREYTPPILGISHSSEYSRTYFDPNPSPDSDRLYRAMVAQNFQFRGRTPYPTPGTTP